MFRDIAGKFYCELFLSHQCTSRFAEAEGKAWPFSESSVFFFSAGSVMTFDPLQLMSHAYLTSPLGQS